MLTSLRKIWLLGSVLCLGLMVFACGSTPDDTDGADAAKLDGFDGMGLDGEAERLTTVLGNKRVAIMGNHGVLVIGNTVADVFDELYYFEKAAENLITALSSGRPLRIASHEVAEKTACQFEEYPEFAERHLNAIKDILDEEEPEYRQ